MSYADMIRRVGRIKGRLPRLVEVPVLTPWLSALWIELVTPARAESSPAARRRPPEPDGREGRAHPRARVLRPDSLR
jgi:hypothetical protein